MKKINWKETLELIGIFSILLSLLFIALQLRQEEKLIMSEMRAALVANQISVNTSIIDNAEIWAKGTQGQDLSLAELAAYERLVNNVNHYFFHVHKTFELLEPESKEQIISEFAGFLYDNPGAYQVWIDRERRLNFYRTTLDPDETVTSGWIEAIESRIARMEQKDRQ